MFYRRKIQLALLEACGDYVEKIKFQKLLLIFSEMQKKRSYEFVPFKFGCFSFSANADLNTMVKQGILESDNKIWKKIDPQSYFTSLSKDDQQILKFIKNKFIHLSTDDLIEYTYLKYPFYAVNSQIAADRLTTEKLEIIKKARPLRTNTTLFTIGYEGISLEKYFNKLLIYDVKVLIDVRNNPLSMKYGFSKSQLQNVCTQMGIQYIHLPEVGIESSDRQDLNSQSDYDKLFSKYKNEVLPRTTSTQAFIFDLLKQHERVALTCFEANIRQCHRKHLAEAITKLTDWQYELKHI